MKLYGKLVVGAASALLISGTGQAARNIPHRILLTPADLDLAVQLAEVSVIDDLNPAADEVASDDFGESEDDTPSLLAMEEEEPSRIVTNNAVERTVDVSAVTSHGDLVTGTVVNRSSKMLRDVTLLVRRAFLWNDERHPGEDDPGKTITYTLPDPIPPHANRDFAIDARTEPQRADGRFITTVEVESFTEVSF